MFRQIFDLSYVRNYGEALVFYFCYFLFGYYISGLIFKLYGALKITPILVVLCLTPFAFYTSIAYSIVKKKNLRNLNSYFLISYAAIITICIPAILVFLFGKVIGDFNNIEGMLLIAFLPAIALAGIPVAILSTKEDFSINKIIKKIDKEEISAKRAFEKGLLIDRIIKKTK